jgi:hypothetical protein
MLAEEPFDCVRFADDAALAKLGTWQGKCGVSEQSPL